MILIGNMMQPRIWELCSESKLGRNILGLLISYLEGYVTTGGLEATGLGGLILVHCYLSLVFRPFV